MSSNKLYLFYSPETLFLADLYQRGVCQQILTPSAVMLNTGCDM